MLIGILVALMLFVHRGQCAENCAHFENCNCTSSQHGPLAYEKCISTTFHLFPAEPNTSFPVSCNCCRVEDPSALSCSSDTCVPIWVVCVAAVVPSVVVVVAQVGILVYCQVTRRRRLRLQRDDEPKAALPRLSDLDSVKERTVEATSPSSSAVTSPDDCTIGTNRLRPEAEIETCVILSVNEPFVPPRTANMISKKGKSSKSPGTKSPVQPAPSENGVEKRSKKANARKVMETWIFPFQKSSGDRNPPSEKKNNNSKTAIKAQPMHLTVLSTDDDEAPKKSHEYVNAQEVNETVRRGELEEEEGSPSFNENAGIQRISKPEDDIEYENVNCVAQDPRKTSPSLPSAASQSNTQKDLETSSTSDSTNPDELCTEDKRDSDYVDMTKNQKAKLPVPVKPKVTQKMYVNIPGNDPAGRFKNLPSSFEKKVSPPPTLKKPVAKTE